MNEWMYTRMNAYTHACMNLLKVPGIRQNNFKIHFAHGTMWTTISLSKFWGDWVAKLTVFSWVHHLVFTMGFPRKSRFPGNPSTPETTCLRKPMPPFIAPITCFHIAIHTNSNVTAMFNMVLCVCCFFVLWQQWSHFSLSKLCTCLGVFNITA